MLQENYNLLSAWLGCITLAVTITGLLAVYVQIKKIRETSWSNTHMKLCDQSFELLKLFMEHPKTYDYFYNKKILKDDEQDKVRILYATEALANFMEHLILQKKNLPVKQWEVWERFIYTTFKSSIVIRNFIQDHREWYSTGLLTIADKCKVMYD